MKELIVDKKNNNTKLNNFLLNNFDGLTINTIYKALRKKDILVNNIRINKNTILYENDIVSIYISDKLLYKQISLDIIYEDTNILVVNKDIGIEVVSNKEKSLTDFVKDYYNRR